MKKNTKPIEKFLIKFMGVKIILRGEDGIQKSIQKRMIKQVTDELRDMFRAIWGSETRKSD